MKQKLLSLLLAIFASISIAFADASGTCGDNLRWNYNSTTHVLTITGDGAMEDMDYVAPWYQYLSEITSVSLPNGLTSIRNYAFQGCTGLTSITIPNSVTSIGKYAFYNCTGLTSIIIPNSVTSIGEYAFYNVANIVYNGSATGSPWGARSVNGYVDGYLVYNNASKTQLLACSPAATGEIDIPNSVTSIGKYAFYGCTGLSNVTIPESVTSIGDCAFYGCTGLTSMTIPNSVTSIGNYAFYGCRGLTSVTIGNSVTSIGRSAFAHCTGLTSVTIPNSVTSIGFAAFRGCTGLTNVTMGNSVEIIEACAFEGCSLLESIILSANLREIDSHVFADCTALQTITLPQSVEYMGEYVFWGCHANIIMLPTTPPQFIDPWDYLWSGDAPAIDGETRYYGASDNTFIVPCDAISSYSANTNWRDVINNKIEYDGIIYSVTNCGNATVTGNINISGNIEILQSVTLLDNTYNVTGIESSAFSGCTGLTSITIPNSVTSIEEEAFSGCTGLTSITIPNSVTSIEEEAFSGCTGLTSVSIGENVRTIGNNAFKDCIGLENLYCYRTLPPNAYSTAFDGVDKFACVLHVPSESIDYYKNAAAWRDFFYVTILGAETADVTALTITPHEDNADVMWPAVVNAYSYEFTITDSNGNTVCTLTFNANGQLTGLILHAPAAEGVMQRAAAGTGFSFNVTGLQNGNSYNLVIKAKDSNGTVLQTFAQDFTTGTTALENINADDASGVRKVIEDGNVVIIMPDGRKFDASGRKLR